MKKYILSAFLFLITYSSFSQSSNWKLIDVEKTNITDTSLKLRKTVPTNFEVYKLDTQKLKNKISFTKANEVIFIELPTPDGIQKFSIKKASSLSLELTEKFPMIVAYVGKGIDNPSAVARISFGTDGFHGVIFYGDKPSFYIDPYTKNNDYYIAYSRSSLPQRDQEFRCGVNTQLKSNKVIENTQKNANDGRLRTFRLALVCSGEYADFHLNDQGVPNNASDNTKKAAVLSAMNTSMTRINGVFERDLGVRMEIVGNNDQIIFLDAASDGITDGLPETMINQVQTICDNTIGNGNYDIGHIFSIGGSGLAGLGVVCLNGQKARGVTGRDNPTGDPYDIDYVSHEMGHQFGANHTQNNGCNRNNLTAVEPGSASTIMGYAGICFPNVQNNSDDHFHSVSITEMWNKIQSSASCGLETLTGNTAPEITEGTDYTIPKSTPFVLRGVASDIDTDDVLSYNWEQMDNQVVTMPPVSTSTTGPAFRSNRSMSSPNRYMPALPTVIAGSISSTWEVVPTVAREMNFSLVVRDNVAGGANSARDDIKVTTQDITPFTVNGPSTNVDWAAGSTQTINWVVGTTNQAPVNSQNMNILLSTDGGISFPITLASGTANDGTHTIVVPNDITTQARILVEAADNIFYNVNISNFTISASGQTCSKCASEGTTDFNTSTTRVIFNTIDNATGKPAGYSDYTNISTAINRNTTYDLTVQVNTDGDWQTRTLVWIDWNQNCDFDDAGEEYTLGTASDELDGETSNSPLSILIPSDASIGQTTMRVSTRYNVYPTSCLQGFDGEVEDYTLNVIDSSLACNGLSTTWNGLNWSNGVPQANTLAIIEGPYDTTTGSLDACALQVDAALTVAGDTYINIDGDITINPTGSLTVAHTGSVVQVQETATVTNNGAISVLVETPNLDVLDFMIMGSPMTVETREDVWGTASVVNKHTTTDFTTYENPLNPVSGYNFYDSDVNDWSATSGILSPGEGYLVRPQAQVAGTGGVFNYDFNTGSLNTGPLTYALDYNSDPGGPESSPSVLSNPYPSGIQIQLFLDANPQIDAVYLWEHNTSPAIDIPSPYVNKYSMEDVSAYNLTGGIVAPSGGAIPNGVISTGQGFGVFASAQGTATFNNGMRLPTGNTTLRNSPISRDRLWLNVNSTVYNVSGNTLIGFIDGATPGVDNKYDNGRIASKVSLYSHIQGSDRGYSIQAREAFEDSMTIALGFSSIVEEVTSYKISLSDFDGEAWLEATPYLVDNQTGVITNLMEDSYNFTSDMGEFNDRFEIIFQDRSLGSQQSLASSIAMYPNPASDVVTIASPTAAITMVEVRDIRGRLILNKAVTSQNVTTINVASLDSALYLVTITTDSGSITSRLIIE